MVHETGAIHQHLDRPHLAVDFLRERLDRLGRAHVKFLAHGATQPLELAEVEIGGDDLGAFGEKCFGNGASDPLPGRGDELVAGDVELVHFQAALANFLTGLNQCELAADEVDAGVALRRPHSQPPLRPLTDAAGRDVSDTAAFEFEAGVDHVLVAAKHSCSDRGHAANRTTNQRQQ